MISNQMRQHLLGFIPYHTRISDYQLLKIRNLPGVGRRRAPYRIFFLMVVGERLLLHPPPLSCKRPCP